jgi:outer membrane protein assembly factor BamB
MKHLGLSIALTLSAIAGVRAHEAERILKESGMTGGLVVHVGCGDGQLTAALHASNRFVVHGLDADVTKARETIRAAGLYGPVSAQPWNGDALPYTDNLVSLVVVDARCETRDPGTEILRVLAPRGSAIVREEGNEAWLSRIPHPVSRIGDGYATFEKPVPAEIDDWSHFLHNASGNPVGKDKRTGPPRQLQWEDGPRGTRSHERMSSVTVAVTSGGRVFSIMDEGPLASVYLPSKWSLTARDAFNGIVLWKKPIPVWHTQLFKLKSGPFQLPRRLVAVGERVYVTLGLQAPVSELDAATGEIRRTFEGTEYTEEIVHSNGTLLLVVNNKREPVPYQDRAQRASGFTIAVEAASRSVVAIDTKSGKTRWREECGGVTPLTLISDGTRVFFHSDDAVHCLDTKSGDTLWQQPMPMKLKLATNSSPGVFVQDDVLCFAQASSMTGFSAGDGQRLWSADCDASVYRSPIGACVIDGTIWIPESAAWAKNKAPIGLLVGYDLKTGERTREMPIDVERGVGVCHHRCSMPKAVDRFLVTSWPGVEFIDTTTGKMRATHWIRGACLFGSMPANGLVYAPPNPCACYPEAKLNGYLALAPKAEGDGGGEVADEDRLEKGPAFGAIDLSAADDGPGSWPTLRGDNKRSGASPVAISSAPKKRWSRLLGGTLTQPVVADGKVFVALVDTHAVSALDANDGHVLWTFTAGGRVDSSPTFYRGLAIFGARDGSVYCLNADTGELVWKFFAAVNGRQLVSCGQVESLWPVSGSVLIEDGALYFAAGKSGFLTGGITLYRLDPATGKQLSKTRLDLLDPDGRQTKVDWLSMPGALPDVLSSDGDYAYMRHIAFGLDGQRLDHPGNDHLYSASGFLDRSEFHRTFWKVGRGSIEARTGSPTGEGRGSKLIAMSEDRLYHYGRAKAINAALKDGEGYFISCTSRTTTLPDPTGAANRRRGRRRAATGANEVWNHPLPMYARAMVLADQTLFLAGAKGDWSHSDDVFEGRKGITLLALSASDGKAVAETPLDAFPVFDGMSVAYGRLFVSDDGGTITCLE